MTDTMVESGVEFWFDSMASVENGSLQSSWIQVAAYNRHTYTLLIVMEDKAGKRKGFVYADVPEKIYRGLIDTDSAGEFYNIAIKHRYDSNALDSVENLVFHAKDGSEQLRTSRTDVAARLASDLSGLTPGGGCREEVVVAVPGGLRDKADRQAARQDNMREAGRTAFESTRWLVDYTVAGDEYELPVQADTIAGAVLKVEGTFASLGLTDVMITGVNLA